MTEETPTFIYQRAAMPKSIADGLAKIMAEMKDIKKTGRNKFANYDYATDYDIFKIVQTALGEEGISLSMEYVAMKLLENNVMAVEYDFRWHHKDGSESAPIRWMGVSRDVSRDGKLQDKWFAQTSTSAAKYFVIRNLQIPVSTSVDDPDSGENDLQRQQEQQKPEQQKQKPKETGPKRRTKKEARDDYAKMVKDMKSCMTGKELAALMKKNEPAIKLLPADWEKTLREEAKAEYEGFRAAYEADQKSAEKKKGDLSKEVGDDDDEDPEFDPETGEIIT